MSFSEDDKERIRLDLSDMLGKTQKNPEAMISFIILRFITTSEDDYKDILNGKAVEQGQQLDARIEQMEAQITQAKEVREKIRPTPQGGPNA